MMMNPPSSRGPGARAGSRPTPRYSREQMETILQRALQKQSREEDGVTHDELLAAAQEVGIPREHIEAAVSDLEAESAGARATDAPSPAGRDEARQGAMERAYRIQRLFRGVLMWMLVSGFFIFVGRHTGHHGFFIVSMFWGLALVMRALNVFFPKPERARRESRRERRERLRSEKRREQLAIFERKVAIGTDALGHLIDRARGSAPAPPPSRARVDGSVSLVPPAAISPRVPLPGEPRARVGEAEVIADNDEDEIRDYTKPRKNPYWRG